MIQRARCTALLDACVLYPLAMTDALMSLAVAGLFTAKWTTRIEQEWILALERNRPDLAGRLTTRRDSMREAIPDWEIPEHKWTILEAVMSIPDPNDKHVLAAAVAGDVDYIVTSNLQDFPPDILAEYGLEAVDPDAFVVSLCAADWTTAITAFAKMRARRRKPQATASDFADALATGGLPMTANRLRTALDSL